MRVLAWVLFVATCAMFALQAVLLGLSGQSMWSSSVLVDHAFPLVGIGAVVGAGIGLLITTRYPRNAIGWLFLVGQLGSVIGLAAEAFAVLVAEGTIAAPMAGQVCGYLKSAFDATYTMAFLSVIFMIAPDGRPLSPRWRAALCVPIAAYLLRLGVLLSQPASDLLPGAAPQLGAFAITVLLVDVALLLISLSLGAAALVIRMRTSTPQQRLQLRWVASAATVVAVALLLYILGQVLLAVPPWPLAEGLYLAYIYVSVAVGIAILRYRLYDIDVILSRAIVLAVLAAFVTIGYIAVVVLIGAVLAAFGAPGSTLYWPSLVATALVAAAFQPLRRHVLRVADQLVYGRRAAPYEALASLSRRLADAPSPEALPGTVAEATGRAVGAAWTCVTIEHSGVPVPGAGSTWPASITQTATPDLVLPVLDLDEQVGTIEMSMPPGRPLRTFERRLVQDVAAQAGVAFRNALLQAELAARVAEGQARSADLAASRRRLVGAEDEARARLADDIRLRVIPHLTEVDTAVRSVRQPGDAVPQRLEEMIAATERAVQELRRVCRGVFPALLERRGLVPALAERLSGTCPAADLIVATSARQRLGSAVEAAGYVFCEEVSSSSQVRSVGLAVDAEQLTIRVVLTPEATGLALGPWQQARDRIAALDGEIAVEPCGGGGADVEVRAILPLSAQEDSTPRAADQTSARLPGPSATFGR